VEGSRDGCKVKLGVSDFSLALFAALAEASSGQIEYQVSREKMHHL
jgi:hypothetical protein